MRFAIAVLVMVTWVGSAHADKAKKPNSIDIKPVRDKLLVLTDGAGHYVVLEHKTGSDHLYYSSDGRDFYTLRSFSASSDPNRGYFSKSYWAPRASARGSGEITLEKGEWKVACGERKTKLVSLPAADAGKLLDKGIFLPALWKHQAYALARDDRGTYYYVDRLRKDYGGKGFRLWVGQRGTMVRQKMTNIVADSEGDIFATKKGDLRMILNKKEATWVKGKRRTSLTHVPVWKNAFMIYAELGVYLDPLGTPCDDM